MDRVAVTGGYSFIGTGLCEFMSLRGDAELIDLNIKPPQEASAKKYETICDLLNLEELQRSLSDFRPNKVVHLTEEPTCGARCSRITPQFIEDTRILLHEFVCHKTTRRLP